MAEALEVLVPQLLRLHLQLVQKSILVVAKSICVFHMVYGTLEGL
jgi:hypothetical protein